MDKVFSLKSLVDDLLEGLDRPELSWDIDIKHVGKKILVSFPIKFYGERRGYLDSKVRDVAKLHGLTVANNRFRSDYDLVLDGEFGDIQMIRL